MRSKVWGIATERPDIDLAAIGLHPYDWEKVEVELVALRKERGWPHWRDDLHPLKDNYYLLGQLCIPVDIPRRKVLVLTPLGLRLIVQNQRDGLDAVLRGDPEAGFRRAR